MCVGNRTNIAWLFACSVGECSGMCRPLGAAHLPENHDITTDDSSRLNVPADRREEENYSRDEARLQ